MSVLRSIFPRRRWPLDPAISRHALQAVIFDWSGTLCDDHNAVLASLRFKRSNLERAGMLYYGPSFQALRRILAVIGFKYPTRLVHSYSSDLSAHRVLPHIQFSLQALKTHGIPISIVSTQSARIIIPTMQRFDLLNYIDTVAGEVLHKGIYINRFLRRHQLNPASVAYVSDQASDLLEVRATGVITCGVSWGYDQRGTIASSQPHFIFDQPSDLSELLRLSPV